MSDSVANLTVKVDTKSVSAAVQALEKLAVKAGVVHQQMQRLGNGAAAMGKAQEAAEKKTRQSESALAKMEKRLEDGARKYEQITRLINKHALAEGMRADTMGRLNRAFEQYNRVASNVNATTLQIDRATRRYNQAIEQAKTGIQSVVNLERQRATAVKQSAAEINKSAKEQAAIEKKRVADALALQSKLQQAQLSVFGITSRASRQLSPDMVAGITRQAEAALSRYTTVLNAYGVRSLEAGRAAGSFAMTMKGLSSEIARVGGLLPRVSENARIFSAAFGAANASMGGFSRLAFNTTAALSALAGAFGLREIIQAGFAIEQFANTLKTVSENTLGFQRNLNFLFTEADRIGFAVGQVGGSFARLSLAMKGAGFQAEQTRETFTNLVSASRNFGISSADTMGVIRALEQSMSKGKFMAEEVRLQLGDRLPVAMAALERAVTKVDGKQSDLNKRFEEGSLDVARYGVEFARQIFELSGGAEALGRTSQTVQAAFARVNNELVKTNMLFKESGFDAALISVSAQLERIIVAARESGAVEGLAKSFELLAENIDLVAGALAALSLLALPRIAAALLSKWTLIAGALAGIGTLAAGLFRGPERDLRNFEKSVQSFESTYQKLKNNIESVNQSLAQGASSAASSAESSFERLIRSYEKMGESAARAVSLALRAQIIQEEKTIRDLETQQREILNNAANVQSRIEVSVGAVGSELSRLKGVYPEMATGIDAFSASLLYLNQRLKEGKIDSVQFIKGIEENFPAVLNQFVNLRNSVGALKNLLAEKGNFEFFQNFQNRVTQIAGQLASAVSLVAELRQQEAAASRGILPTRAPSEPIEPAKYTLPGALARFTLPEQARREAAGLAILQSAYKAAQQTSRDATKDEIARFKVFLQANKESADAARILKAYDDAMRGSTATTSRSTETLDKYLATLRVQIENQDKIAAAYRISTQAGEDAELQLKADTEAIRLGAKTEAERIALKKQILPLLQKEAQGEKNINAAKDLPRMRDEIALLEKEQSLLGQSVAIREQELAVLRARQQARGASAEDLAEIERATRRTTDLRQQNQFLENSYNEISNVGVRAFEQVGDAITEAFAKGELRALRFGDIVRGVMSSIIQSIIRLGIINPVLNSVFGAMRFPTLGAGLSVLGGGGVAGAAGAAGGGSLLSALGSLSSLLPKGGIFGSLGLTGAGGLFSRSLISAGQPAITSGALLAAGEPGLALSGIPGATTPIGGLTVGGLFSGLGMGATAGGILASLTGGNAMGGSIGGAIGGGGASILAAIPAIAGFLGPLAPFAPLIGGLLGGGLGGIFGPKPSSRGFSYNLAAQGGRLAPLDYRFFNEQGRAQFQEAEAGIAATNALLQQFGLTVTGGRAVGGNRFGMGNLGYGEAASFSEAFASLQFAATSNEQLSRALSSRAFEGVEKLQEFLQGFTALQDTIKNLTADPVPEFTQQMNALIDSFAEATAKAREYGIEEDELLKARDKQIARLEEQRRLTIRDTALELEVRRLMAEGMDQEAQRIELAYRTQKEIESFTASLDALGITAEEKSRLLVELERTQAAERVKILKDTNKDIRDYLDSLRTGALSGTTTVGRLSAAEEIFTRDLALAQAGNVDALNRITQSADTLLNLARETYASTSGFHTIRGRVVSSLEALSAAPASVGLASLGSVPMVSDLMAMRENAAVLETAEYTKQFDSKMAELLPIAEAIQAAVEQTNQAVVATSNGSDFLVGEGGGGDGGFALGGIFRHGRVMAYANGGIPDLVNGPTLAPMALFGEAGPEAIMPLRRGPDGRLGVEVNGSGSQAVVTELRAVRDEIINLRESVEEADSNESGGVVEAIAELRIQIGGLREELRTTRLRAQ